MGLSEINAPFQTNISSPQSTLSFTKGLILAKTYMKYKEGGRRGRGGGRGREIV
jgi:hypothetical protein